MRLDSWHSRRKRLEELVENTKKRYVRHGCVDCVYYELPLKSEPCKSCERHSNWVDKREAAQELPKPENDMI